MIEVWVHAGGQPQTSIEEALEQLAGRRSVWTTSGWNCTP